MGQQYLSEIRLMTFGFPPRGRALCNGQLLPIQQNQALFALLGTTYGGNGQTTFALPDLRGRTPMHTGPDPMGTRKGAETHTVQMQEMPQHNHLLMGTTTAASTVVPSNNVLGAAVNVYGNPPATSLLPSSLTPTGGSQAHNNMQPYTVMSYCIALQGIFPSQT